MQAAATYMPAQAEYTRLITWITNTKAIIQRNTIITVRGILAPGVLIISPDDGGDTSASRKGAMNIMVTVAVSRLLQAGVMLCSHGDR